MYVQRWHTQDHATGALERTLAGIVSLAGLPHYNRFRAAVAYATVTGCAKLVQRIEAARHWLRSEKRWLISIDFGRTEPKALEFLAALPKAEVRIPFGARVVARGGFAPIVPFHPKVYAVDDGCNRVFGTFVGSGNLTASGLLTGSESGVLAYWLDPTAAEKKAMASAYDHMSWFDEAWGRSDPLADVIGEYKRNWKKSKPPFEEDNSEAVELYAEGAGRVISGKSAVAFASAKALWVEIGELYKNRGAGQSGNQVDLPRGCRVFFGFPATTVARNTVFGDVMLQNDGFSPVRCSVRFGNNQMDKVNLPVPGTDGPATYDNSILMFERKTRGAGGLARFRIVIGSRTKLEQWKKSAPSSTEMEMQSGRKYGLLL